MNKAASTPTMKQLHYKNNFYEKKLIKKQNKGN